jgi:nucleotide-binding universal stress UspA family protein
MGAISFNASGSPEPNRMQRFQRILSALTLTDDDATVLRWTALVAGLAGARHVTCLHGWNPVEIPADLRQRYPWLLDPGEQELRDRMEALVSRHLALPAGVAPVRQLRRGNPLGEILRLAEEEQSDLIVVARGPDDAALAEKLARKAPCSVLAVPTGAPARCERVLGAVDFSSFSTAAIEVAAAFARAAGGSLTLFHAYRCDWGHHRATVPREDLAAELRTHSLQKLTFLSRQYAGPGLEVGALVTYAALPGRAIADHVNQAGCDLVAIGCRGHHAIYATLLGSTAEAILRECPCPVLAVKSKGSGTSLLQLMRRAGESSS